MCIIEFHPEPPESNSRRKTLRIYRYTTYIFIHKRKHSCTYTQTWTYDDLFSIYKTTNLHTKNTHTNIYSTTILIYYDDKTRINYFTHSHTHTPTHMNIYIYYTLHATRRLERAAPAWNLYCVSTRGCARAQNG